ncbi:hypothetical protein [Methylobacterium nigriterrae]|uniref:hypothetical protein n=1 Tax=Methylobacterium nigriterrae TaxID=3127512 RepID=UPI003013279F
MPSLIVSEPMPGTSLLQFEDGVTRAVVLSAAWKDLNHVRRWIDEAGLAAVYVLAGRCDGQRAIRIGEGAKLRARLADHLSNPQLGFVTEIYVLASEAFTKAAVVRLQERLTDLALADGRARLIAGCGPLRGFPLSQQERQSLDLVLLFGLHMLNVAGCRAFAPLRLDAPAEPKRPRR